MAQSIGYITPKLNLIINQGATFNSLRIVYKDPVTLLPIDLTGYSARMQIRLNHASDTIILDLPGDDGDILLGTDEGVIQVDIPASVTEALPAVKGVYDLELITGTYVERLLEGSVVITPEVTR